MELEETSVAVPKVQISQKAEATGSVSVEEIDLDGKSVTLKNNSEKVNTVLKETSIKQSL